MYEKKLTKCEFYLILYLILARKYSIISEFLYFPEEINKIPEFYMIFARKIQKCHNFA